MENLVIAVNQLTEAVKATSSPRHVIFIMAVAPILLTLLSISVAYYQHSQNKKLQKEIHNRDNTNRYRNDLIEIYHIYHKALFFIPKKSLYYILSNKKIAKMWTSDMSENFHDLTFQYDKANLIINDQILLTVLSETFNAYNDFYKSASRYINSSTFSISIENAWKNISSIYKIEKNDYHSLHMNNAAREQFELMCKNEYTTELEEKIEKLIPMFSNDNFDKHFLKYTLIQNLQ